MKGNPVPSLGNDLCMLSCTFLKNFFFSFYKNLSNAPFLQSILMFLFCSSAGDTSSDFPSTMVQLCSFASPDWKKKLKFKTEVYSLLANRRAIVAVKQKKNEKILLSFPSDCFFCFFY